MFSILSLKQWVLRFDWELIESNDESDVAADDAADDGHAYESADESNVPSRTYGHGLPESKYDANDATANDVTRHP